LLKSQRDEAERQYRIILDLETSANFTGKFEIEVNDFKVEKIVAEEGIHTTTCLNCNRTCHDNCVFANNEDKKECVAMTNGFCTKCKFKCSWDKHANLPFIYKETVIKKK